jgi:Zn-dependent protease
MMGRMTLNPMKHIDPVGAILFVVTGFGWASPVPINPSNFKNRWGLFFTAAAGIVTNYIMAFLIYPIYILVLAYVCPIFAGTYMSIFLERLFSSLIVVSLSCTIFNLLPLSPLDGFRIVEKIFLVFLSAAAVYAVFVLRLGVLPAAIVAVLWLRNRKIPCKEGVCKVQ